MAIEFNFANPEPLSSHVSDFVHPNFGLIHMRHNRGVLRSPIGAILWGFAITFVDLPTAACRTALDMKVEPSNECDSSLRFTNMLKNRSDVLVVPFEDELSEGSGGVFVREEICNGLVKF